MVRQIRLTTRCASTMAAGTMLSGLLHGRRRTSIPSLLPPRPPKDCACPWTTLTLPENQHPLGKSTYSDVLRAPPPNHKHFDQCAQRMPLITSTKPSSRNTSCPTDTISKRMTPDDGVYLWPCPAISLRSACLVCPVSLYGTNTVPPTRGKRQQEITIR
jgi:hypothetical protein